MARLDLGKVKGDDGFSPTVETSKSGKVTTITITDEQGPHVATILDGEDGAAASGDMKKEVYDTNNNGIVDNAEKVNNHTVLKDVPADAVFTDTVFSGNYNDLTNKPAIPDELSDLSDDSTHRLVTDTEKNTWSGKQDALTAGSNITISGDTISATDTTYSDATTSASGLMSSTDKTKLNGIAAGAEVNVQANWNETDTNSDSYIQNKPTIPEDMQYSTMPTASVDNLGKIVQYIGATDITYINGYFYKCVSDGESTPTYSWENIDVQEASGGSSYTAGTNISIDANNAINCDVPYSMGSDTSANLHGNGIGTSQTITGRMANAIGNSASAGERAVAVGHMATSIYSSVAIGAVTNANAMAAIAIGDSASSSHAGGIAIGAYAATTKGNQAIIGSGSRPINYLTIRTSQGEKDLATQEYADSKASQASTIPTASADYLGKIVQFTGTTDSTYTNGYFYKCVSDGQSTPTYSWEEVEVQAGGGGTSYTAGTNISIDSNNAINCSIPFSTDWGNITLGNSAAAGGMSSTVIGTSASSSAYNNCVALGASSRANYNNSIALGYYATTTKANQMMIGASNSNINEIAMYTSNGVKVMATEDYVDNLVGNINTVLATLTTPSNGGNA